jgi:hypothetical protein
MSADEKQAEQHDGEATPEQEEKLREEVLHAQEQVSEAVLKSELGWEVINDLAKQCVDLHLSTRGFTTSVLNSLPKLDAELTDPKAFRKTFHTFLKDLGEFHAIIMDTHKQHAGKTGQPTQDELPLVMELSLSYSKIMDYFEMAVRPLWVQMLTTIEQETDGVLFTQPMQESDS